MKLLCPKAPDGLSHAVNEAVARLNLRQLVGDEDVRSIIPAVPHRVYSIHKRNLRSARRFSMARSSSWLVFLLLNGHQPVAAVSVHGRARKMRARAIHPGFPGPDVLETVALAEAAEAGLSSTYEFRLLIIPTTQTIAIWLHGPKDDFFLPVTPSPREFVRKRLYTSTEFTSALFAFLHRHIASRKALRKSSVGFETRKLPHPVRNRT